MHETLTASNWVCADLFIHTVSSFGWLSRFCHLVAWAAARLLHTLQCGILKGMRPCMCL